MTTNQNSPAQYSIQVCCSVEKSLLNIIRRFISNVAEEIGFSAEDIYKIEMAVDEACSNVILHAYDPDHLNLAEHNMQMNLMLHSDSLEIVIEDRGKGTVDPNCDGAGEFNNYVEPGKESYNGLGLLIIKEFMDEFEVDAVPEKGTRLTMKKYLSQDTSA